MEDCPESARLAEEVARTKNWKRWGPYLSERQWGTVREDYSAGGRLLELFPARPCAQPRLSLGRGRPARLHRPRMPSLCFAPALWNGVDPILKERLFGLTNGEGNHGEDVKEAYFFPRCAGRPTPISARSINIRSAHFRMPSCSRRTRSATNSSANTRSPIPRLSRKTGISTWKSNTRRAVRTTS